MIALKIIARRRRGTVMISKARVEMALPSNAFSLPSPDSVHSIMVNRISSLLSLGAKNLLLVLLLR
jgi:hypothetical protein